MKFVTMAAGGLDHIWKTEVLKWAEPSSYWRAGLTFVPPADIPQEVHLWVEHIEPELHPPWLERPF